MKKLNQLRLLLKQFVIAGSIAIVAVHGNVASAQNVQDNAYNIGGVVEGLTPGNEIGLINNGSDNLIIQQNGMFVFPRQVADGAPYEVVINRQPVGQVCQVLNGSGTARENVYNIQVTCQKFQETYSIGGAVQGLARGNEIGLINNGSDNLIINQDGMFVFPRKVAEGAPYAVVINRQPIGQLCWVANGSGTARANVWDIIVNCQAR